MPRDYKHRANRKPDTKPTPGWVWLLAGLAIGLFIAFLVFLKSRPEQPQLSAPLPKTETQDVREVRKPDPVRIPPPPKPRFDFYTILPEQEVVIPEREITGKPLQGLPQVEQPGTYLLQAGSFRKLEQADQLRAQLALLGLESDIQIVTINGNETWHRVRVGPFSELKELNGARTQLKENHIDAILLRIQQPG